MARRSPKLRAYFAGHRTGRGLRARAQRSGAVYSHFAGGWGMSAIQIGDTWRLNLMWLEAPAPDTAIAFAAGVADGFGATVGQVRKERLYGTLRLRWVVPVAVRPSFLLFPARRSLLD